MPFRMSRTLRFWVEVDCKWQDLSQADDDEVSAILQNFERCGDAMRCLNRRSQVIWRATPQFVQELNAAKKENDAEWANEN